MRALPAGMDRGELRDHAFEATSAPARWALGEPIEEHAGDYSLSDARTRAMRVFSLLMTLLSNASLMRAGCP